MIGELLTKHFPSLSHFSELKDALIKVSSIHTFESGTVILKEGEYVKVIPLLIKGLVKVFKEEENGNEVLLYYIKDGESCVMSMISITTNEVSKVKGVVEEEAEILVIPSNEILKIAQKYPEWNEFMYDLFDTRYEELLSIIKILTFSNKDLRLLEYLKKETNMKGNNIIKTTHQQIGFDLGTSREVISRLLKKMEHDGLVRLKQGEVEVL